MKTFKCSKCEIDNIKVWIWASYECPRCKIQYHKKDQKEIIETKFNKGLYYATAWNNYYKENRRIKPETYNNIKYNKQFDKITVYDNL